MPASTAQRGLAGAADLAFPHDALVTVADVLQPVLPVARVVREQTDDRVGPAPAGGVELTGVELYDLPDLEAVERHGVVPRGSVRGLDGRRGGAMRAARAPRRRFISR